MGERVLLFGPPGVGKGTQAVRLAATLRVPHVATGDILRVALQSHTPLGRRARQFVESGELVPDAAMVELVRGRLGERDAAGGFILDGFPRTVSQAVALGDLLRDAGMVLDAVIVLDAPTEALVRRLSGRRICEHCQDSYHVISRVPRVQGICDRCGGKLVQRADDAEATVRFRHLEYGAKTQPVIEFFNQNGWPVRMVDAIGDIDQIFGRIYAAMFWRD
jgi:adenylate kinase